jgi:hypothetical protein
MMLTLFVTFGHGEKMEDNRRRVRKGTIHREFSCPSKDNYYMYGSL